MINDLSSLSLNELYDKLSEYTSLYSKSMLNGFTQHEFDALRSHIEEIQKEITKRKEINPKSIDGDSTFPPQQSASA